MIEDNESVSEMMDMFFEQENDWHVTFMLDGEEGWRYFQTNDKDIDMVILDLNLPSKDGVEICRDIRKINNTVPIIMLTARDSESDQVLGLGMGADDYVTKPFSPITLMARIRALYRRVERTDDKQEFEDISTQFTIETAHIQINVNTREAYYDSKEIANLTPKEFDILELLASRPKQVFTRDQLLTRLWEDPFYGDERTVDAHIKKLRQKIEAVGSQVIQTVWGVGYKFDESEVK